MLSMGNKVGKKEDALSYVFDSLTTAVICVNADKEIVYLNSATAELFQLSVQKVIGALWDDVFSMMAGGLDACNNGRLTVHDLQVCLPDGQKVRISKTISFVEKDNASYWLVEIVNTDRHHRIVEEDERWHQYEASNMLVKTLAHEVKNPLAGIYGATQLLEMRFKQEPKAQKFIDVILNEVSRLKNLVDRMLGPKKSLQMRACNLHELMRYVLEIVQAEKPENIKIRLDYDPSIPEIFMDFESMVQAFLNIVQNAIQAMEEYGGFLTLKTRVESKFTLGTHTHPLVAVVSVIDEGVGIPEACFDSIFYPMVTTKKQGTGLGLPVSQNIVRQHGGLIVAESEPGHTVFNIYLPVTTQLIP